MTILVNGLPDSTLVYSAKTQKLIKDGALLARIGNTDTSLSNLDFDFINKFQGKDFVHAKPSGVVEVQQGDTWSDYRPARPEDFVGRKEEQKRILAFLESVRTESSNTRVFAITGDSGMGKSSLIAKLRSRTRNIRYKKKYYLFAVDVRAATNTSYIYNALLTGLQNAAANGFGVNPSNPFRITNPTDPLSHSTIQDYLKSLKDNNQVVCIILDQFEELYSKTSLFPIFEVTQNLLLRVTSTKANLVLGFAWKTDSTVHQSHPAYYLWHRLSDYRIELQLKRFTHSEASSAITIFQKEIDTKLRSDLRRQLIENSQGFPWLLKKLSIHVYEQIHAGVSQSEIMSRALDVESLFKRDLQQLNSHETACLRMIAKKAPADWYEILDFSDQETLQSLIQKRLVVRSGDRLNLYWDIFKEYVLTDNIPTIPQTYLPDSPSLRTMLGIAQLLEKDSEKTHAELGKLVGVSEKSVGNVVRDLIMFGIATGSQSRVKLADELESSDPKLILRRIRRVLQSHALTISLIEYGSETILRLEHIIESLQDINPAAQHQERTWKIYAERMTHWLSASGLLEPVENGWKLNDQGEESINPTNALIRRYYSRHPRQYRENTLFIGDTSPHRTVRALGWLLDHPRQTWKEIESAGHRNGARTLINLRIIRNENGKYHVVEQLENSEAAIRSTVFNAAQQEPVMDLIIPFLKKYPIANATDVGTIVAKEYEREWTESSQQRIGSSLKQWGAWLSQGKDNNRIPTPPGRGDTIANQYQLSLLSD